VLNAGLLELLDGGGAARRRGRGFPGPVDPKCGPRVIGGHREAGAAAGTGLDFLPASRPRGDLALAERYMRRAGYPSGRYTGDERFLAAAGNTATERSVALVVQAQLAKLGFRVRTRFMPDDALFTSWCTVPSRKLLTCGSGLAWLKDFPDPQPMLQPVFDGASIAPAGNTNYSQLDDPAVDAAMARAQTATGEHRALEWGRIDTMIMQRAPAVPLQWDVATLIRSKDVHGVPNVLFDNWDLAYTSVD
jgi:peptide/nickel transport system substrate-binding protein